MGYMVNHGGSSGFLVPGVPVVQAQAWPPDSGGKWGKPFILQINRHPICLWKVYMYYTTVNFDHPQGICFHYGFCVLDWGIFPCIWHWGIISITAINLFRTFNRIKFVVWLSNTITDLEDISNYLLYQQMLGRVELVHWMAMGLGFASTLVIVNLGAPGLTSI